MPIKLYYSGAAVAYGVSEYQRRSKRPESNKPREYTLTSAHRNDLIASALYGWDNRKGNICFLTLTYPIDQYNGGGNASISKWVESLRSNYGCAGYLWTKELTKKGTPHYHVLCDIPFTSAGKLNRAWCKAAGINSTCALRTNKKNGWIVKDRHKAAYYCAKYAGKSKGVTFPDRCYSISQSWQVHSITIADSEQSQVIFNNAVCLHKNTEAKFYKAPFAEIFRVDEKFAKEVFESYGI